MVKLPLNFQLKKMGLGIFRLGRTLGSGLGDCYKLRFHFLACQAAEGDHPALLNLLEVWIVILPPPLILTRIKKIDL